MKINRVFLLITLCLGFAATAMAIPAKRGARVVQLENGENVTCFAHGDEFSHWLSDAEGNVIEEQEDGTYIRLTAEASQARITAREASPRRALQRAKMQAAKVGTLNIAPRGLVILVNYTDKAFSTDYSEMHEMINGDNYTRSYKSGYTRYYSEGSARRYFIDQSLGQYLPEFTVVGPYTLSHELNYYGANDYSGNDKRASELIIEACQAADADGVDFSQFDCDKDGEIDFVFVIYAGYGEADGGASNTIWPHSYWVYDGYGKSVKLDGKRLNTYACANELAYGTTIHTGIGPFVHEFSHVLGLPDLYCTTYASHRTMDDWDVMDYGPYNNDQNTPPAYSAYERFYMGWLKPDLLNAPRSLRMEPLITSNEAYIVTKTGTCNFKGESPNPTDFYIVENRQIAMPDSLLQKADVINWDKYLSGSGMMITHVQYSSSKWQDNTVNNTASSMGVDMIEAGGAGSSSRPKDLFPTGATEYAPYKDYPITEIVQNKDLSVSFDFMGGADWVSSLALEKANTGTIVYSEVVGVYDLNGHLLRDNSDGTLNLNDLPAGTYIVRLYTGDNAEKKKYKGVKIIIR